jgi:hypothetical protein
LQSEKRINLKTAQSASNKTFLFFKKRNFKNKVTGETVRTVVARTRESTLQIFSMKGEQTAEIVGLC